jgi:glycosyltransferase involved in cell wall biosynthesis
VKVLRISPTLKSTTAAYNQFTLGFKDTYEQTHCSLHKNEIEVEASINCYDGSGSVRELYNILRQVLKLEQYDIVHIHNGLTGLIFIFAALPLNISILNRTIFTLHNSWQNLKFRNKLLNFFVMIITKKTVTCGKASLYSLPWYVSYLLGSKIVCIENGFNCKRIDQVRSAVNSHYHYLNTAKRKVVYIGSLTNIKNQEAFLDILNDIKTDLEVIFLGDGVNKSTLLAKAKLIHPRHKIIFKGSVSREEVFEHLIEADIFVSFSLGEGLPVAVLEAMYAGCFLVLSNIEPHIELNPPNSMCIYLDVSDKKNVIKTLNNMLLDFSIDDRNVSSLQAHAEQHYSLEGMIEQYNNIYLSLR